jgi:hypothetical protein
MAADKNAAVADSPAVTHGDAASLVLDLIGWEALDSQVLTDLRDMLGHHIAAPPAPAVRETRLGLLVDLCRNAERLPSPHEYDLARKEQDEPWPAASTLADAFIEWERALRAAVYILEDQRRIHSGRTAQKFSSRYSRDEIIWALQDAYRFFGYWPSQWDYFDWACLERARARAAGAKDPRLPGLKQVRKPHFGSFDRAIQAARRDWENAHR